MACVYRYVAQNGDVLYVGKTKKLDDRITAHRYEPWYSNELIIEYIDSLSQSDADILETYYISTLRPKHNIAKRWEPSTLSDLARHDWKLYSPPPPKPPGPPRGTVCSAIMRTERSYSGHPCRMIINSPMETAAKINLLRSILDGYPSAQRRRRNNAFSDADYIEGALYYLKFMYDSLLKQEAKI